MQDNMGQRDIIKVGALSGLVDAILGVGSERKALLDRLRSSLESGNDAEALRCARTLCGLQG